MGNPFLQERVPQTLPKEPFPYVMTAQSARYVILCQYARFDR